MSKLTARLYRKTRVRKKINGSAECLRLSVFRSVRHISVQLIDDSNGKTVLALSSQSKDFSEKKKGGSVAGAKELGVLAAKRAISKGIKRVVFDRNGFLYHGRIKALADGAREGGLQF